MSIAGAPPGTAESREPEVPEAPDTPEAPGAPDTPEARGAPEVTDKPDTPDAPSGVTGVERAPGIVETVGGNTEVEGARPFTRPSEDEREDARKGVFARSSASLAERLGGFFDVATGADYPDALSAAAAGGALGAPVLLVDGVRGTNVSKQMLDLLTAKAPQTIYVAGGKGAVNLAIESNLKRVAPVKRLAGVDRYKTNEAVNTEVNLKAQAAGVTLDQVWIATGRNFPDALSAAAPAGHLSQRLVLSKGTCVPKPVVSGWIEGPSSTVSTVSLVGGKGVLSSGVEQLKECG